MTGTRPATPLIAIFNSSSEVVARICEVLEREGLRTVTGTIPDIQSGALDFVAFLGEHDPDVIIVDLPRPYERNLNFVRLLWAADRSRRRRWIITTVQKDALERLLTPWKWSDPIIGQPFGPEDVLRAVRALLRG
jgi:DNA-binding NarL/FixJ family response regulator